VPRGLKDGVYDHLLDVALATLAEEAGRTREVDVAGNGAGYLADTRRFYPGCARSEGRSTLRTDRCVRKIGCLDCPCGTM
jgi:hypothetical protein